MCPWGMFRAKPTWYYCGERQPRRRPFWIVAAFDGLEYSGINSREIGRPGTRGEGVWHARLLDRHLFLVSTVDVPVNPMRFLCTFLVRKPRKKNWSWFAWWFSNRPSGNCMGRFWEPYIRKR